MPSYLGALATDTISHGEELKEVKRRIGITHPHFDHWVYRFLENKKFNVEETEKKLRRRFNMEVNELATYGVTDFMMENMQKGIMHIIGNDREGRVVFYVTTARDKPTAARREECRMNFDMMVSYGTRLRKDNKRCQMVMLVNQAKASFWSNVDMTFQADIALRIAKFYPGCVDKIYVCNMNRTLTTVLKPIFSHLPAIVSDRIVIVSDGDKKSGKLFEYFDPDVLPVELGGNNTCDHSGHWDQYARTVKEYYEQLKHAVVRRGLSVKEWELEMIFPHGLPEETDESAECMGTLRSRTSHHSGVAGPATILDANEGFNGGGLDHMWSLSSPLHDDALNADSIDLITCDTVDTSILPVRYRSERRNNQLLNYTASRVISFDRRSVLDDFVDHFLLLESFFRKSIDEASQREWLTILQRESTARHVIQDCEQHMDKNKFIFSYLPSSLQIIARGLLWMVLLVMSFYFLIASVFFVVLSCCLMGGFFFSMLSHPYNVFIYACPLLVTGYQASLLCSRGFELTRRTYNGVLIDTFAGFGFRALLVQASVYLLAVFGFFVVFCVMTSKYDVSTGMKSTLAAGWITSAFMIFLYHFLYAFGISNNCGHEKHSRRSLLTVSTLYFFFDVDMDDSKPSTRRVTLSELTVTVLTVVAALAVGVAYLFHNSNVFLTACITLTFLSLLLLVIFITFSNCTSTGCLIVSAVLYTYLTWLAIIFTDGAYSWRGKWGISLSVLLSLALTTDSIVLWHIWLPPRNTKARRWVFRTAWLWIILQLITAVILAFLHDYRLGIFTLCLVVHLLVYGFCVSGASSAFGVSVMVISLCMVLLFFVIYGGLTTHDVYSEPSSAYLLPNYTTARIRVIDDLHNPPSTSTRSTAPVCWTRYPNVVDITGMALFAKLAGSISFDATLVDLRTWFPEFTYVTNLTFSSPSPLQVKVFSQVGADSNTTVITVGSSSDVRAVRESGIVWINSVMVSLLALFTPPSCFVWIAMHIITPHKLLSLLWPSSLEAAQRAIDAYISTISTANNSVYLVGHGLPGGAALYFAVASPYRVNGIGFVAPVDSILWSSSEKVSNDAMSSRVFSVMPSSLSLTLWWPWGNVIEIVPCEYTPFKCRGIDTMAELLYRLCDDVPKNQP